MLAEFLSWWFGQLAALLAPLRGVAHLPDALLLRPDAAGGLTLARRRRGQETSLPALAHGQAPMPPGRRETLVLAMSSRLLLREVTVPLAAERSLESMLAYEIDRLTPFAAADVLWTHRVLGRDRALGRLRLELALVPRAALAPVLSRLAELGMVPQALEAAGPDGAIRRIALAPPDPARLSARRRQERWALAACVAVALALAALPFLRQSLALADTAAKIAALRPAVQQAEALRQHIIAGAGTGRLAAARAQAGDALLGLSALTELLPDDTWLTSLSLRKRQVSIEGHSAEATRLIALLAADPRLRNPAFIAPVVRAEDGSDIFSIRAGLVP